MCDDIDSEHLADTVRRMSQLSNKISRLIIQFMQVTVQWLTFYVKQKLVFYCLNLKKLHKK